MDTQNSFDPNSIWESDSYRMFSGQADASARSYHLVRGKSGKIWLYAEQEDAASNIYIEGGPGSNGFGGSTLTFRLVEGGEIQLKGPWHSNSDALYRDTKVDLRHRHYTFGVVSLERLESWPKTILRGILYKDESLVLGTFDRMEQVGQGIADSRNETVYVYRESKGGSSCGPRKPGVLSCQ